MSQVTAPTNTLRQWAIVVGFKNGQSQTILCDTVSYAEIVLDRLHDALKRARQKWRPFRQRTISIKPPHDLEYALIVVLEDVSAVCMEPAD